MHYYNFAFGLPYAHHYNRFYYPAYFWYVYGSPYFPYYEPLAYGSYYGYGAPYYGYDSYYGYGVSDPYLSYFGGGYGAGGHATASDEGSEQEKAESSGGQSAESAAKHYADALTAFKEGKYFEAARLAGQTAMDKHDDPKVHELLSLAMFALGDYRGAAIEAHAVLYFGHPADWATIYGYYGGAAKYTEHLRALEKSVGEKPESPAETFLLGYHYLMLGHQDAAIKMLRKAVELAPQDLPAKKLLYPLEGKPAPQSPSDRGRGKPDTDSGEAKGLP